MSWDSESFNEADQLLNCLEVDIDSTLSLITSPTVRSISVLSGLNHQREPPISPLWYFDELGWREILYYSWEDILSWRRLLVIVKLVIFDSILSILLNRRVGTLCTSTLVSWGENSENIAAMILAIMAIELGCCDASHMHYPQHFCVVSLRKPYEKAEGCHLPY